MDLAGGNLRQMGPGMLPRVLAFLLGASGIILIISSYWHEYVSLERWSLRGLIFILGAVIVFSLTVRPLGLAVAGPLALVISGGGEFGKPFYRDRDLWFGYDGLLYSSV